MSEASITDSVQQFITDTFKRLDQISDVENVLPLFDPNVMYITPERWYIGHAGYREWYAETTHALVAPVLHTAYDVHIKPLSENVFEARFKLDFQAQTESGQMIRNDGVDEYWLVTQPLKDRFLIRTYVIGLPSV